LPLLLHIAQRGSRRSVVADSSESSNATMTIAGEGRSRVAQLESFLLRRQPLPRSVKALDVFGGQYNYVFPLEPCDQVWIA